ncbi:penicillin-binding protein [Shouchella shacheensis]|uniref:penicillin-binding protein n=1 Tax=Shouchella shacheensis TaxID=1649580 RepID=UPI00073FE12B|nr:penicillin-binding protein [Shouchella shacheensis]
MDIKRAVTNKRAVFLMLLFLCVFLLLFGRILYIQAGKTVRGHDLVAMAESFYATSEELPGERGDIFDRSGNAIAEEVPSYKVLAYLDESYGEYVEDPEATAETLAPYIDSDPNELESRLSEDKFQVELGSGARNLTYEQMKEIEALDLDGIASIEETKRFYPNGEFASHLIGYSSSNEEKAKTGLEASLDDYLQEKDGFIEYEMDRRGLSVSSGAERVTLPEDGDDVYTTLDTNIQASLELAMTKVDEEYNPEKMTAIVADPKTGEILGMSNRPGFNPNAYEDVENYMNYAISDSFEPGSTMKTFTLAAAIEEGVFDEEATFESGSYEINSETKIHDVKPEGWGTISYREGVLRSSNVLMTKLALDELGPERFYPYWDQFGFMDKTGIDLPQEGESNIIDGSLINAATTSYGQGSTVTPIQIIQAASAIANDGKMMKPYVVKEIVSEGEEELLLENEPEQVGQPVSAETAAQVRSLLRGVVADEVGSGNAYDIDGLEVAGKTGTAQIASGGTYLSGHGNYTYSFLGMAPYEDPEVVVYVAVTKPNLTGEQPGTEPVAHIFNTVMQRSLEHLSVAPSKEEIKEETEQLGYEIPDFIGTRVSRVESELEDEGFDVHILGDEGTVEAQQPNAGTRMMQGEKIVLRTNADEVELPDMYGWSYRDVMKVVSSAGLETSFQGSGYLDTQSVEPGETIARGDVLGGSFVPREELDLTQEEEEETEGDVEQEVEETETQVIEEPETEVEEEE